MASHFHLSRQMKVTKAKALFICHSGVATGYCLSTPCWGQAARLLRFLLRAGRCASRSRRKRSEVGQGTFAKQATVLLLGSFRAVEERRLSFASFSLAKQRKVRR